MPDTLLFAITLVIALGLGITIVSGPSKKYLKHLIFAFIVFSGVSVYFIWLSNNEVYQKKLARAVVVDSLHVDSVSSTEIIVTRNNSQKKLSLLNPSNLKQGYVITARIDPETLTLVEVIKTENNDPFWDSVK